MVQLRGDGEQSTLEALEGPLGFFIVELATIHLQEMAGSRQRLADSRKVGMGDAFRN